MTKFVKVASVSGGKDSVAMLIVMKEQGIRPDYVVFLNTGIEFPQQVHYVHQKLAPWVKENFSLDITEIHPKEPFALQVKKRGVPFAPAGRWCCRTIKKEPFYLWLREKGIRYLDLYLGYAADEEERFRNAKRQVKSYARKFGVKIVHLYAPLLDADITEEDALKLTRKHGLYNELYDHFKRTGCYLCPYQSLDDWRALFWNFPKLFNAAKTLEEMSIREHGKTFRRDYTLAELEMRFRLEKRQAKIEEYVMI
ncbi:hypothetical protein E3E26_06855 [Thermococcus sp. LS1]|uniref:phosphoadenosine phosphosulfate reductase domain-containing protein n=1 Tax=Thermococcus sp. LS1 TaxID=1638259 RepID=UPI00143C4909|nr:hypothetical protein [Thermococcus sp. LS1]